MAIQLSAWLWLRNNDVRYLTDRRNKTHYTWPGISDKDIDGLAKIVEQVDKLHSESDFEDAKKMIVGAQVMVPITARYVEFSRNPDKSAELFQQIHEILKNYRLRPEIYRRLGEAHKEIGAKPKTEDFAKAIEYMTLKFEEENRHSYHGGLRTFCWRDLCKEGYPSTAPF